MLARWLHAAHSAATPPAARPAGRTQGSMDRERDYYAERRDRDRQSTRTLEVWKEGRLLEELDLTACRRYTVGRTEGSDVWTEHESCSRTHAEFRVEAGGVGRERNRLLRRLLGGAERQHRHGGRLLAPVLGRQRGGRAFDDHLP